MDGKCAESNHALESLGFEIPLTGGSIIMETTLPRREVSTQRQVQKGKRSPVKPRQELPHAWLLESASNLTNPGLGETGETKGRSHLRILSESSQMFFFKM